MRFLGYNIKRQRGRVRNRAYTGASIAKHRGKSLRWLTLSTWKGYDGCLSDDFTVLNHRLEHVSYEKDGFNPFRMVYFKVNTDEGNGVIHALFYAEPVKSKFKQLKLFSNIRKRKGGRPVNRKYDIGFVPFEWIKSNWAEITGNPVSKSQNVYIEYVYGSPKAVAGYCIQYSAGQDKLQSLSYSAGWLYRGAVKDWNNRFKPRVAELYSFRTSLEDEQFNADMRSIYQDWDKWIIDKVVTS